MDPSIIIAGEIKKRMNILKKFIVDKNAVKEINGLLGEVFNDLVAVKYQLGRLRRSNASAILPVVMRTLMRAYKKAEDIIRKVPVLKEFLNGSAA